MAEKTSFLTNMENLGIMGSTKVANLSDAPVGHFGIGLNAPNWDANTPLVLPPAKVVMIAGPTMFDDDPVALATLKNMVECLSKSITGIPLNYTLETEDTIVGYDGQSMAFPKRTTRSGVNPSITYQELIGNPIWNFHRIWITKIRDPDTAFSFVGLKNKLFVTSAYSMTLLFIQYDVTGLPDQIVDAFVVSNMFPTETTELGAEKTTESKGMERTISYTGFMHHNNRTRQLGVDVAKQLKAHTVDYFNQERLIYGLEKVSKNIESDLGILADTQAFASE